MVEYKPSFIKSHRNTIIFMLIFTVIFGFRLYYDYTNLQPILLPVVEKDVKEGQLITEEHINTKAYFKINLNEDTIISKNELIGKYAKTPIYSEYPISKKQIISEKVKYGYLADISSNKRVIPLPSDVNSSGINTDDRIEITSSPKESSNVDEELEVKRVYSMAIVKDKIDAKGISYDVEIGQPEAQRGNIPKVLMVEVTIEEAIEIEDAIAKNDQINVRLVPPSAYKEVN